MIYYVKPENLLSVTDPQQTYQMQSGNIAVGSNRSAESSFRIKNQNEILEQPIVIHTTSLGRPLKVP